MTRIPPQHRALSHEALRDRLAAITKLSYARTRRDDQWTWDPLTSAQSSFVDLGRGLLDSFALALHVLWTYQQAWAEEGFLATARLDSSVGKLLGHIGYQPRAGTAATGLQHFRCKDGTTAVLPPGLAVVSPALTSDERAVTYETLAALRISPDLNEMRAYLPKPGAGGGAGGAGGTGGTGGTGGKKKPLPSGFPGEPRGLPPNGLFSEGSVLDALRDRIEAMRHGPLEDRRIARARQEARKLASMINQLELDDDPACKTALDKLCKKLCDAQKEASKTVKPPPGVPVGSLSEVDEIIARQLRCIERKHSEAQEALDEALRRCPDEDNLAYAARLDQTIVFLEAFVECLLQEARDNLVLLRGAGALDNLDRVLGASASDHPPYGWAGAGVDSLFLLDASGQGGPGKPGVRPGDWLVLAEEQTTLGPDAKPTKKRIYREAVRIIRVRSERPPGERRELTRITFQPPLRRSYNLDAVVIIGNNTMVSAGATVVEVGKPAADRRTIPLGKAPLTWLRDPQRPGGRRAEAQLVVAGRKWRQVDNLLAAGPDDAVFAVETVPGGGARLRVGDSLNGAPLPQTGDISVRYRVGVGRDGNRAGLRVKNLGTSHPAVDVTFNPLAMTGGADPEAAGLARTLGPATVGAGDRAVSVRDVQAIAEIVDGVRRASVFVDPVRRRAIVVVVTGPDGIALAPAELEALRTHLLARVPPGVDIRVENRIPVPVKLRALLRIDPGADPVLVARQARLRLGVDRDPDSPPGLLDAENVELGEDLQLSQVYDALYGIEGLRSVVVKQLHRMDDKVLRHDRVVTSPREMLIWAPHQNGVDGVELPYEEARDS